MSNIEDNLNILMMEKMIINKILNQTIDLIHATRVISAIKKLVDVYDILHINQEVISRFKEKEKFCWDKAAVQDLSQISKELIVYHRNDFDPIMLIFSFNQNISNLIDSLYANDRLVNN